MTPSPDVSDKHATLIAIAMMVLVATAVAVMTNTPKLAYQEGANPMTVISVRAVIATLTLGLCIAVTRGRFRLPLALTRLALCTGALSTAMLFTFYTAIQFIGVSLTILIMFVNPFLIGIYNHMTGISRLTVVAVFSGIVALIGLGFALAVDFSVLDPVGLALAGLASVFAAAMVIVTMRLSVAVGAVSANFHMALWSLVIMAAVLLITDSWQPPETALGWTSCLVNGLSFAVAYLTFFSAAKLVGVTRVAMLSFMEPVATILLAAYMFQEYLSLVQWGGVALVAGGLLFMEAPLARSKSRG